MHRRWSIPRHGRLVSGRSDREAEAADKIVNDARHIEATAVHDLQVPASDDAFALIESVEGAQGAYLVLGSAIPEVFDAVRGEGREFPFFAHEPIYVVDLDAITYGTKIATILALDVLG